MGSENTTLNTGSKKHIRIAVLSTVIFGTLGVLIFFIYTKYATTITEKLFPKKQVPIVIVSRTTATSTEFELQTQAAEIIKAKDSSLCDMIATPTYRTVCTNNIALNAAMDTLDITKCDALDNVMVPKKDCLVPVILKKSVQDNDPSICEKLPEASTVFSCKANVYTQAALKAKDPSLCNASNDKGVVERCNNQVVLALSFSSKDKSLTCANFMGTTTQADCVLVKQVLATTPSATTTTQALCKQMKTQLFTFLCRNNGPQRMPPSGMTPSNLLRK